MRNLPTTLRSLLGVARESNGQVPLTLIYEPPVTHVQFSQDPSWLTHCRGDCFQACVRCGLQPQIMAATWTSENGPPLLLQFVCVF